jgi:hypothetical protein
MARREALVCRQAVGPIEVKSMSLRRFFLAVATTGLLVFSAGDLLNAQETPPPASPPATTTTADRDHDRDWGWIGLLGLIGLAGLAGRRRDVAVRTTTTRT